MSDDRGAVTAPATGPAEARALRRSNLPDDDGPGDDLVGSSGGEDPSTERAGPNDAARDAATAADQAARMSALNARSDDLLERLRGNGAEDGGAPAAEEPDAPTRRWWRRS